MSKHKKHPHAAPPSLPNLRHRLDKATAEGRFQQALELARQLHKQEQSPVSLELVKAASLARVRQLHEQKYDRDALSMLDAARHIDPLNPTWLQAIADLYGLCGGIQQAMALVEHLPEDSERGRVLVRAADAAIQKQAAGRALLPPDMQPDFDRILQAFREIEAGQDDQAKTTLQGIGLRSPFLEWKVFLRGLQAYYQQEDARAVENWQRLDTDRLPARLAAPFRFQIDAAFRAAQPPATQAQLRKQADHVSSNVLLTHLRQLRTTMGNKLALPTAFRQLDTILPQMREAAPHMLPRLASCFYWAIFHTGPDDITRYQRVFGMPADDPHFNRLQALALEHGGDLEEAHEAWRDYQKDLTEPTASWSAEEAKQARALVWLHMGQNAASQPSRKKMPPFLRGLMRPPPALKPPAAKCFQESLKLAPDLLDAHEALFLHEIDEERTAQAIKAGQRLLQQFPDHAPTLERLASLLQEQGKFDEALALTQRALQHNPLQRQLRDKVSAAHVFCARPAVLAAAFDKAREHYRQALAMEPANRAHILCKWAGCEFKAGNPARAEELIQEAGSASASPLQIGYLMLIETLRLNLDRALKTRFEREFKTGLALPPTAADAVALLSLTRAREAAETDYTGRKNHVKQVLTYAEKARKKATFAERDLVLACECLMDLHAGVRCTNGYIELGRRHFPANPLFPYLQATQIVLAKKRRIDMAQVSYLLGEASRLAHAMPEGPEKKSLLDKISAQQQAAEMFNPFGGFAMPDLFDMFDDDDDDDDEGF